MALAKIKPVPTPFCRRGTIYRRDYLSLSSPLSPLTLHGGSGKWLTPPLCYFTQTQSWVTSPAFLFTPRTAGR